MLRKVPLENAIRSACRGSVQRQGHVVLPSGRGPLSAASGATCGRAVDCRYRIHRTARRSPVRDGEGRLLTDVVALRVFHSILTIQMPQNGGDHGSGVLRTVLGLLARGLSRRTGPQVKLHS
jgi:hypothetical protein